MKGEKISCFFKMLCNRLISLFRCEAGKFACFFCEPALCINGHNDRNFGIVFANNKVFNTVAGSSVNTAGARIKRYMIADDNKRSSVYKRMAALHIFKLAAHNCAYDFIIGFGNALCLHGRSHKICCHNIIFAAVFNKRIFKAWAHANCNVCGQGPRCGCPNNEIGVFNIRTHCRKLAEIIAHIKLNIN